MDASERFEKARHRANSYAPAPSCEPLTAGILGAAAAGFCLALFAGLSRTDLNAAPFAALVTLAAAFSVPFFVVKSRHDRHSAAVSKEFDALRSDLSTDQ